MIIENQKVYYRFEDDKPSVWKLFQLKGACIEDWCEKQLQRFAFQDSSGDYQENIEFDIDGSRYFALGYFNGWYFEDDEHGNNCSGSMSGFDFLSAEQVAKFDKHLKPHPYSPYRDYIHLNSRIFRE